MSILFSFPGQGTQKANMLARVCNSDNESLFDATSEILGHDVLDLDNESALQDNQNTQIAMMLCGVASARILQAEGISPDFVLGLSVGAFPAAVVSGMLSFDAGMRTVQLRGQLMRDAYPQGYGMMAISGLSTQTVKQLVELVDQDVPGLLHIANINTEHQTVVSGRQDLLKKLADTALEHQATSAKLLKVNVPSHCRLLGDQAAILNDHMKTLEFSRQQCCFVSANRARVLYRAEQVQEDLAMNMANQVHWWESVAMLNERGVKLAIELSPGSVLTKLCTVNMPTTRCLAFDETRLNTLVSLSKRSQG